MNSQREKDKVVLGGSSSALRIGGGTDRAVGQDNDKCHSLDLNQLLDNTPFPKSITIQATFLPYSVNRHKTSDLKKPWEATLCQYLRTLLN